MPSQTSFVLREIRDQFFEIVQLQSSQSVVVFWSDCCAPCTLVVDQVNFAEMVAFFELSNERLSFGRFSTHMNCACSLDDEEHGRVFVFFWNIILVDHNFFRNRKLCAKVVNDDRKEVFATFSWWTWHWKHAHSVAYSDNIGSLGHFMWRRDHFHGVYDWLIFIKFLFEHVVLNLFLQTRRYAFEQLL